MKHILIDARQEILDLRRQNEVLRGQVEVIELFKTALWGRKPPSGAAVDVAWLLQKEIDKFTAAEQEER